MNKALQIEIDDVILDGELAFPNNASGVVIFCHGNGFSRFSPRNRHIARHLQRRGLATFLFDLISREEDDDTIRFNVELLSQRLVKGTEWLLEKTRIQNLPIGYFGASTGAAAALMGASILQQKVGAIVTRGGRPDLAMDRLYQVKAPTLFIVGENDSSVIDYNWKACEKLPGTKSLRIIEDASPVFEEPGTLEQVAELSGDWFINYLTKELLPLEVDNHVQESKSFFSVHSLSRNFAWVR